MKNSIEAMPDGGTIHLRVWKENQTIHITISDTGIGISKERLQKIGEPFFTLKKRNGTWINNKHENCAGT
ncbi:ATP-binding protein [Geobacillus stearothermophilus]